MRRSLPIKTSPLIYYANQWTGFYMIGTSVMKEVTILIKKIIIDVWHSRSTLKLLKTLLKKSSRWFIRFLKLYSNFAEQIVWKNLLHLQKQSPNSNKRHQHGCFFFVTLDKILKTPILKHLTRNQNSIETWEY